MLKALLTLVVIAMFTGAAIYVGWSEHPARLRLNDEAAAEQWRGSYKRAAVMQAGLAVIALLLGIWSFAKTGDDWLLIAGLLVGAAIPWTLIVMLPLNRKLNAGTGEGGTRETLVRWGQLHHVRTLLGVAGLAACLMAFLRP